MILSRCYYKSSFKWVLFGVSESVLLTRLSESNQEFENLIIFENFKILFQQFNEYESFLFEAYKVRRNIKSLYFK